MGKICLEFYLYFRKSLIIIWFRNSELDEAAAIRTIQNAIRKGINYIDTAPFYGLGQSESILGKALKDVPRKAYYIGTKVGRYDPAKGTGQFEFSAEKTRESVSKSLNLLGLEYVDVIQVCIVVNLRRTLRNFVSLYYFN